MVIKKCLICGKEFKILYSSWNKTKFCSCKCYGKARKNYDCSIQIMAMKTSNIGRKLTEKTKEKIRKAHTGKIKEYMYGNKNPRWNNGKTINNGYVLISSPNHPYKNKLGYVREHRLVTEKCLSRYLTKQEIVHHINNNRSDNRPENLYLFLIKKEHDNFHKLKIKSILKSNII